MNEKDDVVEIVDSRNEGLTTKRLSPVYGEMIQIEKSHLDVWGHTNNVCYVQWMQDVAVAHSAAIGWDSKRYLEHQTIWVVRSHTVNYRRSTYLGDKILVQTWIAEMKRASCLREYRFIALPKDVTETEIRNAVGFASYDDFKFPKESLIATAETQWAFVSTQTLRPVKVNPELCEIFQKSSGSLACYPRMEK